MVGCSRSPHDLGLPLPFGRLISYVLNFLTLRMLVCRLHSVLRTYHLSFPRSSLRWFTAHAHCHYLVVVCYTGSCYSWLVLLCRFILRSTCYRSFILPASRVPAFAGSHTACHTPLTAALTLGSTHHYTLRTHGLRYTAHTFSFTSFVAWFGSTAIPLYLCTVLVHLRFGSPFTPHGYLLVHTRLRVCCYYIFPVTSCPHLYCCAPPRLPFATACVAAPTCLPARYLCHRYVLTTRLHVYALRLGYHTHLRSFRVEHCRRYYATDLLHRHRLTHAHVATFPHVTTTALDFGCYTL